jgi:MFS transporter, UMF1 family
MQPSPKARSESNSGISLIKYVKTTRGLFPYSLFDFANSSFVLIIHAYLFPLYFKNVLLRGRPDGDAVWGIVFSSSAIMAAVVAPFFGRVADGHGRYRVFCIAAFSSFVTAAGLSFAVGRSFLVVVLVFLCANISFYLTSNIYDSLLTLAAGGKERSLFSGFAWGFGYLGGVLCFLIVYSFVVRHGNASPLPYLATALFYAIFGAWSLFVLKPHVKGAVRTQRIGFGEMLRALDGPRRRLLLGYLLISDCISTIILFTSIYASNSLHLSDRAIGGWLLLTQLLAFPNTFLVSSLTRRLGVVRTLAACVGIWILVLILLIQTKVVVFGLIALLTSLVIGTTQSLTRAQYSVYVAPLRTSEMFGWYSIATESASIAAPIVFGIISGFFHSQRVAMGALALPLVVGLFLVWKSTSLLEKNQENGTVATFAK